MDFGQILGHVANASSGLGGGGQMFGQNKEGTALDLSQQLPMGGALGMDPQKLMQMLGGTLGGQLMQQVSPLQGLLGVLMGQQQQGQQGAQQGAQAGMDATQQPLGAEPPQSQAGGFQGDGMRREYGNTMAEAQAIADKAKTGDVMALAEMLIARG